MSTEEDLFEAASALPDAERTAFLENACAGQPALRKRLESLLRSHETTGFMVARRGIQAAANALSGQSGERIGRYRLLQQIGEGGFGVVWMAEQLEPVTRRVALKIIKAGMDTKEVIARFEAERQALAMMDHPNIARVFDAGATEQGRPYFVMELVKGIPITRFCDEQEFTLRQRLELFAGVCSAINHAHQKGVIHRDLKPSNVMVTLNGDRPVVKVIDFGIAKATQGRLTDRTLFTRFEQFLGTPAYMSPEQAAISELDIDTRSDIYGLGILLYELLTGTPPFDAKSLVSAGNEEMRRIIREVEPPRPSSRLSTITGDERTAVAKARQTGPERLCRTVEPDLDWIVMKAIEKDRSRRYATADGLALDVRRYLADEPVSARPPSVIYRFRKFARRHRTAVLAAVLAFAVLSIAAILSTALMVAILVAATAFSLWQALRARMAEKQARQMAHREKNARDDAEAVSKFLIQVFQNAEPARNGTDVTVVQTLDHAVKKLDADTTLQARRKASLQIALSDTFVAVGDFRSAVLQLEKAQSWFFGTCGREHPDTLAVWRKLANALKDAGHWKEALELAGEVLTTSRRILGPEHPETAWAMQTTANCLNHSGRLNEALALRENVLAIRRRLLGPEHPDTVWALSNLAISYQMTGRREEALTMKREVFEQRRRLFGAEHPETVGVMHNLADSFFDTGCTEEGLRMQEEVVRLSRKVNGEEHPKTLGALNNLGEFYSAVGRQEDAQKLQEELLPVRRKVHGPEHPSTLLGLHNLALTLQRQNRRDEAKRLAASALEGRRKILGPEHPDTARSEELFRELNSAA